MSQLEYGASEYPGTYSQPKDSDDFLYISILSWGRCWSPGPVLRLVLLVVAAYRRAVGLAEYCCAGSTSRQSQGQQVSLLPRLLTVAQ
eukprot:2145756-Rhodomonas_salina.1